MSRWGRRWPRPPRPPFAAIHESAGAIADTYIGTVRAAGALAPDRLERLRLLAEGLRLDAGAGAGPIAEGLREDAAALDQLLDALGAAPYEQLIGRPPAGAREDRSAP